VLKLGLPLLLDTVTALASLNHERSALRCCLPYIGLELDAAGGAESTASDAFYVVSDAAALLPPVMTSGADPVIAPGAAVF